MTLYQKIKKILPFKKKSATVPFQQGLRWMFSKYDNRDGSVNANNAYRKHTWIYSCINKIANNIARLEVKQYRGEVPLTTGESVSLFENFSQYMEINDLIKLIVIFKKMRGEALLHLIKLNERKILGMELLEPEQAKPKIIDGDLVSWEYMREGKKEIIPVEDVIQFKEANPFSEVRGLSPLQAAMRSINNDDKAEQFNQSILDNGSFPGSIVEYDGDLNDAEHKRLMERWKERQQGYKNAGVPAFITGGGKYKAIELNQQDIAYIEQRDISKKEIHAIYDVPMALTGDVSSFNRANMGYIRKSFWTSNLIPEVKNIERVFNDKFFNVYFPGIRMEFDFQEIYELHEEYADKLSQAKTLFDMGVSFNEINEKLNLGFEEKPERDTSYLTSNYIPLDMLGGEIEEPTKDVYGDTIKALEELDRQKEKRAEKHFRIWKSFIQKVDPIEREFRRKISRFFFELRQESLEQFYGQIKNVEYREKISEPEIEDLILFDIAAAQKEIIAMSQPYFEEAMTKGGNIALADLNISGQWDIINQAAVDALNAKNIEISGVIQTVNKQLETIIKKTLSEGLKAGKTLEQITKDLDGEIKHVFNMASNRAKLIARTEVASSANTGKFLAYKEQGVTKKTWVNSHDSKVRDIHRINETVGIDDTFSNGLRFPGDSEFAKSGKDVCNCRCTFIEGD